MQVSPQNQLANKKYSIKKAVCRFLIIISAFVVVFMGFDSYLKQDARAFCANVSASDGSAQVIEKANAKHYESQLFNSRYSTQHEVIVRVLPPPKVSFLSFACQVTFHGEQFYEKSVVGE